MDGRGLFWDDTCLVSILLGDYRQLQARSHLCVHAAEHLAGCPCKSGCRVSQEALVLHQGLPCQSRFASFVTLCSRTSSLSLPAPWHIQVPQHTHPLVPTVLGAVPCQLAMPTGYLPASGTLRFRSLVPIDCGDTSPAVLLHALQGNGSHILHQFQPHHHGMLGMLRWFQVCLQPAHRAWTSGSRVGEAANPGPEEKQPLRMAVINPTALHGKVPEVLALQADVVFASETSAVAIVQRQLASSLSGHGFKSFFSVPAPPLLEDAAPEHHVRGLATGVAILSRVPARPSLQPFADEVVQTSRLVESFLRIGAMEVRAICVYGIPSCHGNSLHLNNHLLQVALERVRLSRVPAVVAGDWNCDVSCLPAFQGFLQLGYVEAFHAAALRLGVDLPPTCRQSTKHDTALLAPELVSLLVGAEVLEHEALFDSHDPLLLDFAAPAQLPLYARWATPKPWTDFDFSTQELAAAYDAQATHVSATIEAVDSRQSLTRMFCDWAATLERSVDQAIRVQAKAQGSCHTSGLPQAYRGRCQPVRTVSRTVPQLPRQGRTGDFQVPHESTSIRVKWQLRQCRRLRAFRGGVAKLRQSTQPSDALLQQLFNEWEAIKRAKGFDMPFLSWVLTWPCVEFCPVDFPSWEWVNDVMQLVEFSCQALAAQDATRKSKLQAFQIQEDLSLGHSRESFAALRGKHKPPFSAVSTCVEQPVHGVQPQGLGEYYVRVPFPAQFRPGLPVQMGPAQGLVVATLPEDVHVALGKDEPDTSFPLCQQLHDCTPSELQQGFFSFWEPLWNRDSIPEATDLSQWPSFLELLRQSPSPWPSATLDMTDIKTWRHVLRRTSSRRASGMWFLSRGTQAVAGHRSAPSYIPVRKGCGFWLPRHFLAGTCQCAGQDEYSHRIR